MKPRSEATRVALRRAVWASVAIHAVAVGAFFALLRQSEHAPREAAINTRAPHVRMHFTEDAPGVEIATPPTPAPPTPLTPPPNTGATQTAPRPPESAPPVAAPVPPLHGGPFAPTPPRTLPSELVALLRKTGANTTPAVALHDPNVKPAGASGPTNNTPSLAMHGALKPGQTVIYLLDSSGSMGAGGKFDAARAALVATLAQQPATVRFQVIVYDSAARPLLPSTLLATDANVRDATAKLAPLEPRGKSNHSVAVRAALGCHPDVIVLLTDADDLTAAALKPVLATAAKPAPVCVGLVTAEGVRAPRELK